MKNTIKEVKCPECPEKIMNISDAKNVRSLGFAIFGDCPNCGTRLPMSSLWRRTGEGKPEMPLPATRKARVKSKVKKGKRVSKKNKKA